MIPGDPAAVEAAADAASRSGDGFIDAATAVRGTGDLATASWTGPTSLAAGQAFGRYADAVRLGARVGEQVTPVLRTYATELRAAQETYARGQAMQRAGEQTIATAQAPKATGVPTDTTMLRTGIDGITQGAALQEQALERAALADDTAARGIAAVQLGEMRVGAPRDLPGPLGWATPPPQNPPPAPDRGAAEVVETGHTIFDGLGLVPIAGEPFDLLNAAWYAAEGRYGGAAAAAGAAIPLVGWGFTGGRVGVKLARDPAGVAAWVKGRPSTVPMHATRKDFVVHDGNKFTAGERWEWTDPASGKKVRYHAHGRDPDVDAEFNAGRGPIYRKKIGGHWTDAVGNEYTENQLRSSSPAYIERAANDTHIPYPQGQPAPGVPTLRVGVSTPTSLIDGAGGD